MKQMIITPDRILVPYMYDVGHCVMRLDCVRYEDQVFTFVDETGEFFCFDIHKMNDMVQFSDYKIESYAIRPQDVDFVIKNHGIEEEHLSRIPIYSLYRFGLMVCFPDGTQKIVDGNHRMVKRFRLGFRHMTYYLLSLEEAKTCLMSVPKEMADILLR